MSNTLFCIVVTIGTVAICGLCSSNAVVGEYPDLNAKDCGLSRTTSAPNKCFKYHKKSMNEMKSGRNATLGEAPWTVLLVIEITITQSYSQYEENRFDVKLRTVVFTGYKTGLNLLNKTVGQYETTHMFNHPDLDLSDNVPVHDIALLKLDRPIGNNTRNKVLEENNICLPQQHLKEKRNELIMAAGHGLQGYPFNTTKNLGYDVRPLQLGYRLLVKDTTKLFNISSIGDTFITTMVIGDQGLACQGDSGGPIWTNSEGRAVILGVLSVGSTAGDKCNNESGFTIYTRISEYIPWITEVIKNN